MTRIEFICALSDKLSSLDTDERTKTLEYYDEIINDRMEDGMSESEAVDALGDIDKIAQEILCQKPMGTLIKSKLDKKGSKLWDNKVLIIILLIVGSPIWLSLIAAAISLIIALFAVLFSVVICAASVLAAGAFSAFMGLIGAPAAFADSAAMGLMSLAVSFVGGSLALVMIPATVYSCRGTVRILKFLIRRIKCLFV